MPDWLASALFHTIDWILARSTAEVLLFVNCVYLALIAGYLTDIRRDLMRTTAVLETDIQGVEKIAHAIQTATEEISTTTRESMDLVEEIRKVHAPRSYEIDRDDY